MKLMARRAYVFSFIMLLPMMVVLKSSNVGNRIESGEDTVIAKAPIVEQPVLKKAVRSINNTDSLLLIISNQQRQTNNKLDTGLKRQLIYMQSQNFMARKFVQMQETIQDLNKKAFVTAQGAKDVEFAKTQKEILKQLMLILGGVLVIIGLIAALYIDNIKTRSKSNRFIPLENR